MLNLHGEKIVRIEKVVMKFKRPRLIGRNARIGVHGDMVTDPVVRIHTSSGAIGVGWSRLGREEAESLVGKAVGDVFQLPGGSNEAGTVIDLPLWDLVAKLSDQPLYKLLGARGSRAVELYDGSVYIDDLDASDEEAVEIFREEVKTGHDYGYKIFKIKIGRGARWMPVTEGTDRDVLVIHIVREAAGADAKILVDANNGTTLNIAKDILTRCEDVGIYWFEEPFPEDGAFNEDFKQFIVEKGYDTLVADGESGPPPPSYFDMVKKGWIDVVQHDFSRQGPDVVARDRCDDRTVGRAVCASLLGQLDRALCPRAFCGFRPPFFASRSRARRYAGHCAGWLDDAGWVFDGARYTWYGV